ncbi:MAG TPA: aspartate ammonia-lyase [bacterium]|nr:aspartate ammonia-lyase [bacterium]
MRKEKDFLGVVELDDSFPFGINTMRAMQNFNFNDEVMHPSIFKALLEVKKACAVANRIAGILDEDIAFAIEEACDRAIVELIYPRLNPYQGGAGTSMNMAANELIANYALKIIGKNYGEYEFINPLDHVNLSQSTNDVFPTAVKVAIIRNIRQLHENIEKLLHELQEKEHQFSGILKIGRTEMQDAMPVSLGQEFGAWAEGVSRFRWRLSKALDWIREVNIGGTAVGTGINADIDYLRILPDELRRIVEEPLSISRNGVDATQNCDQIVEIMGIMKTGAVVIKKIANDIRILSSGPECGIGELSLPAFQQGSSIMPAKVNPVMAEAAEQVCLEIMASDNSIAHAVSQGNLELQQFMPFIAHKTIHAITLFSGMLKSFTKMIAGITANETKIRSYVESSTVVATLLAPTIGHERTAELVVEAREKGVKIYDLIIERKILSKEKLDRLLTPEVMASPGMPVVEE